MSFLTSGQNGYRGGYAIRSLCRCLVLAMLVCATGLPVQAGGGPENVVLVINRRSWSSKAIANHYASLRGIPASNMIELDWPGDTYKTSVEAFRRLILIPIIKTIERRRLSSQIDYIVYSSDFPYAIDFSADDKNNRGGKFRHGSITGMTYLAPLVVNKEVAYISPRSNWYMRPVTIQGEQLLPSRGFRYEYHWDTTGKTIPRDGLQYILSTMLGYTCGRGNSYDQIVSYLERSAKADGNPPQGTIYFARNPNIRSFVREHPLEPPTPEAMAAPQTPNMFDIATKQLRQMGVSAEVVEAIVPQGKSDVAGCVLGRAKFAWPDSTKILPGAIVDNFTSYGGILRPDAEQTPLTRILAKGAAGSSGTVVEPYARSFKFPHPFIHLHYARGCSLAEAFYQSVASPYQLLVVGDPLCQPWADIPRITLDGLTDGQTISGKVSLKPNVVGAALIQKYHFYVDGRSVGSVSPLKPFELDTTPYPDGFHELRVVGVRDSLIETQGRLSLMFEVSNYGRKVKALLAPIQRVPWENQMIVDATSFGAKSISLFHNRRLLDKKQGGAVRFIIDAKTLGLGPVNLLAIATFGGEHPGNVFSRPLEVEVIKPKLFKPIPPMVGGQLKNGPAVRIAGRPTGNATNMNSPHWLSEMGLINGQSYALDAVFQAPKNGIYQFRVRTDGPWRLHVDDKQLFNGTGQYVPRYIMVPLRAGWHRFALAGMGQGRNRLEISFGHEGCQPITPETFQSL